MMTKEMKTFLAELADLLEKHDVELEATEGTGYYSTYVDGIDCTMNGRYDDSEVLRKYCDVSLPINIDAETLRNISQKDIDE